MPKRPRPYKQAYDGDRLFPKHRGWRMRCCDCGLVHRVNLAAIDRASGRPSRKHSVRLQVYRDNRATAAGRREKAKRDARG